MINIDAIFKNKQLDVEKLSEYGFIATEEGYSNDFPIIRGEFFVKIVIDADGRVDYWVFDSQTKAEYVLAHIPSATGAFVGKVHKACEKILSDISQKCYYIDYFKGAQSKRILQYIKENYHAEPEFLWNKLPEYAALRVPGKKPWFAVVGRVEKEKFGLKESGTVEIINLKDEPNAVAARINKHRAFPVYRMNKQHWYSVFLDERLTDDEIISWIETSYALIYGGDR